MSFLSALKDNAPVITAVAGSVSAFAAAISAIFAARSASKTSAAAEAANHALATALRPSFHAWYSHYSSGPQSKRLQLSNTTPFAALEVMIEVRGSGGGPTVRTERHHRIAGRPAEGVPQPTLDMTLDVPDLLRHGDKNDLAVIIRFSDERGLQRWEQGYRIVHEVNRPAAPDIEEPNTLVPLSITGGEIVPYRR